MTNEEKSRKVIEKLAFNRNETREALNRDLERKSFNRDSARDELIKREEGERKDERDNNK